MEVLGSRDLGSCSVRATIPGRPAFVPRTTERRQEAARTSEQRTRRSAAGFDHRPSWREWSPGHSQGGDTGSNPVGTTRKHAGQERCPASLVVCRGFGDPVEGGLSAGDFVEDLVGGSGQTKGSGLSFQWETQQSIRVCHARLSTSNLAAQGDLRQDPGRAAQSLAGARTYGNGNSQMRVLLSTYTAGAWL